MNTKRLTKLANFLEKLEPEKFDYGHFVREHADNCGTVCCAAGWLPKVDPENWEWYKPSLKSSAHIRLKHMLHFNTFDALSLYFDISLEVGRGIFLDAAAYFHLGINAKDMAKLIRYVVKCKRLPLTKLTNHGMAKPKGRHYVN